jgi:hypothetical protein
MPNDNNAVPIQGCFNSVFVSTSVIATDVATALPVSQGRRELWIYNVDSTNTVYLGDSGITEGAGGYLPAKSWLSLPVGEDLDVYAVCSNTATALLGIMELG